MSVTPNKYEWENLKEILAIAKREDFDKGDVTSNMLPADVPAHAKFTARHELVFCGGVFLAEMAAAYDPQVKVTVHCEEGATAQRGDVLAEIAGPARSVLAIERVSLNFLQKLSGISTITAKYVAEVADTPADIFDTRKTTPGWRELEKYAVRAGGGKNHRRGLYDAVLIKDNHLAILSRAGVEDPIAYLGEKFETVRSQLGEDGFVELEVDTLEQFEVALKYKPDIIMLDNMTPDQMKQAVARRDELGLTDSLQLEASGGITLKTLRQAGLCGVERISIGAITHSVTSVDIGLDIEI